ncbi:MAG: beta-lactamase family protein [Acetobacteraceae bacterium]|nr:beta-lactamase family protein [Acetobacteraceae bacterium]
MNNRIEALLAPWRDKPTPGVTVGVVVGDELVAHRHAGLASLELGVPIDARTRFRVASVSKQFTCAAILLLEDRGRLEVAAPARTLLPELPEAYAGITVAQLMHNTSGIRDMLEIQRLGGSDLAVPTTPDDLLAGICRQRTLNFVPGARFLYSNSNFLLLGLIVERLAGVPLAAFLEQEIFAPLGMTGTRHTPDVRVAIPRLATGYLVDDGAFIRAPHAYPLGGEGGLVSSVEDLALWARNAAGARVLGDRVLRGLERQTPFLNGAANIYARGLQARPYRSVRTFSHGGLWPGFRTEFLRAPDQAIAVIAISNHGGSDPNLLAHRVLDILLDRLPAPPAPKLPPRAALAPMAGRYLDAATGATLDITVSDEGVPTLTTNGLATIAEATEDGRIAVPRGSTVFMACAAGTDAVEVELDAGSISTWHRTPADPVLPEDLPGIYVSEEMAARWVIAREGDGMVARAVGPVTRGGRWQVEPIGSDDVRVHVPGTLMRSWLDVRVARDTAGRIEALVVNGGRVKMARFVREAERG